MTRLMVWMCEARMRVNDYAKQAEYFTEDVVNIFGLDEETAAIVALNALENTLSRLIASLTAEMLEKDSAEVTMLRKCLKSYVHKVDTTLLLFFVEHGLPAFVCRVLRPSLRLRVAFSFV